MRWKLLTLAAALLFPSIALADSNVPSLPAATSLSSATAYLANGGANNNSVGYTNSVFDISTGAITLKAGGVSDAMLSSTFVKTLTTTGTSGAATLVGSTLNIPQYTGGGGASGVGVQTGQSPTNIGDNATALAAAHYYYELNAALSTARTKNLPDSATQGVGDIAIHDAVAAGGVSATNTLTLCAAGTDKLNGTTNGCTPAIGTPYFWIALHNDGAGNWWTGPNATVGALTDGQIIVGQTGATPLPKTLSQDCTLAATGVITCLKTNNTSFGTAATVNTGTSGATIPLLNATNTWSGPQTFTNSDIKLLGSSTGATTFTSANSGSSNFTLTFPAVTDTLAVLGTSQSFTAGQAVTPTTASPCGTQSPAGTMTVDFATSNSCVATFGAGNLTIANPSNVKAGQTYTFVLTQDSGGNRSVSWGGNFKWASATAPTLSTGSGAVDVISCVAYTTTTIACALAVKGAS